MQEVVEKYLAHSDGFRTGEQAIADRWLTSPSVVLDIGCGTGRTSRALRAAGHEVFASDIAEPMVRAAAEQSPGIPFSVIDARWLAVGTGSVDVALFSWNGIDFLLDEADRGLAIAEMARVTRRGGLVALSSHNLLGHLRPIVHGQGPVDAAKRVRWFLAAQRGSNGLRHGIVQHKTQEGEIRVRMQTVRGLLRSVRRFAPGLELIDMIGAPGDDSPSHIRRRSATVHYVWRNDASAGD